ncbi:MAG: hypothetical protein MHM6MM_005497 [Cercozoa sp. M6MM]
MSRADLEEFAHESDSSEWEDSEASEDEDEPDIENESEDDDVLEEMAKQAVEQRQENTDALVDKVVENLAELSDSSDDEGDLVRIGNVPHDWYADEEHFGYDIDGQAVVPRVRGDRIDEFLEDQDTGAAKRTVFDSLNDRKHVLSRAELELIRRLRKGQFPHANFDDHKPMEEFHTRPEDRIQHTLHDPIEPKRRFVPSKHEHRRVMRMVNAIRNGWINIDVARGKVAKPSSYLMWDDDGKVTEPVWRGYKPPPQVRAPKPALPMHAESYNPPAEYLLTEEEEQAWHQATVDDDDREHNFLPQQFDSVRHVPHYADGIKERFERCLDLYLCPRGYREKLRIKPDSLLPSLPDPSQLRPFPVALSIEYKGAVFFCTALLLIAEVSLALAGHVSGWKVRGMEISPCGEYLATCGHDGRVCVFEVTTGRLLRRWYFAQGGKCTSMPSDDSYVAVDDEEDSPHATLVSVRWNPAKGRQSLLLVGGDNFLAVLHTQVDEGFDNVDDLLQGPEDADQNAAVWSVHQSEHGAYTLVTLPTQRGGVVSVRWHARGDFFASAVSEQASAAVLVHRLSRRRSVARFTRSKGRPTDVLFHPREPWLMLALQRQVRIYDLKTLALVKKLVSPVQHISRVDLHPT